MCVYVYMSECVRACVYVCASLFLCPWSLFLSVALSALLQLGARDLAERSGGAAVRHA